MKLRFGVAALALFLAVWTVPLPSANASPSLELPWPAGLSHRINGGNTYGCDTHTDPALNYYAIDFQFAEGDTVSAVAAGTVVDGSDKDNDDRGIFLDVDMGNAYRVRYLHLRSWAPGIGLSSHVNQGQTIAQSGRTGDVDPHLHVDMRFNGAAVKMEPMSGVIGFGWYGFSQESGIGSSGCVDPGGNIHDPSPNWTSQVPNGPDACSFLTSAMYALTRGTDLATWQDQWNGVGWSGWGSHGGTFLSDPSCVSPGNGSKLAFFALGQDDRVWWDYYNGTWAGWTPIPGGFLSAPDACSWGTNRIDLVARGYDNRIWHASWSGSSWTTWSAIGSGNFTDDPSCVSRATNDIDVFARGQNNAVYWSRSTNGGASFTGWQSLNGVLTSGPDACAWSSTHIDVFFRGADNAIWGVSWNGSSWTGTGSLLGNFTGDPGCTSRGGGQEDVFARGTDARIWSDHWTGGPPAPWQPLAGTP